MPVAILFDGRHLVLTRGCLSLRRACGNTTGQLDGVGAHHYDAVDVEDDADDGADHWHEQQVDGEDDDVNQLQHHQHTRGVHEHLHQVTAVHAHAVYQHAGGDELHQVDKEAEPHVHRAPPQRIAEEGEGLSQ